MKKGITIALAVLAVLVGGMGVASACEDRPTIWYYSNIVVAYPDNVAGFDTPMERAYVYQGMLNEKVDLLDSLVQQRYQYRGRVAFITFYQDYYQGLQNKYQKMYCTVGNKVIGD